MARTANISRADLMLKGRAYGPNAPVAGSKPGMFMSHLMLYRLGAGSPQGLPAPAVGAAGTIAAAQAVAVMGDININGTLAASGVATLDVARVPNMVSTGAGDTTQTVTIRGTDIVGRLCQETRTLNGTTVVPFQKAFKTITRITVAVGALAGNLSVGTTNIFGLPVRVRTGDVSAKVNNAVPEAGTIVAGDLTTPTAATGDPMGTFLSGTAPNGTNIYSLYLNVEDDTENAYGTQFSS